MNRATAVSVLLCSAVAFSGGAAVAWWIATDHESSHDETNHQPPTPGEPDEHRAVFLDASELAEVFLPPFTLQGVEGKTFHPLAYTVGRRWRGRSCLR